MDTHNGPQLLKTKSYGWVFMGHQGRFEMGEAGLHRVHGACMQGGAAGIHHGVAQGTGMCVISRDFCPVVVAFGGPWLHACCMHGLQSMHE